MSLEMKVFGTCPVYTEHLNLLITKSQPSNSKRLSELAQERSTDATLWMPFDAYHAAFYGTVRIHFINPHIRTTCNRQRRIVWKPAQKTRHLHSTTSFPKQRFAHNTYRLQIGLSLSTDNDSTGIHMGPWNLRQALALNVMSVSCCHSDTEHTSRLIL